MMIRATIEMHAIVTIATIAIIVDCGIRDPNLSAGCKLQYRSPPTQLPMQEIDNTITNVVPNVVTNARD